MDPACPSSGRDRVLRDSLPSVSRRQFCGTNLCALCILLDTFLDSSQGIQEATGYEPNYGSSGWKTLYFLSTTAIATSPTSSSCTGSFTATMIVPLLSSMSLAHFNNRLFTILAQQTVSLSLCALATLASRAPCIYSSLSLKLECPPGSFQGVRGKRSSKTPIQIFHFTLLCLQIPQVGGSSFLGFTSRCRPAVGGPAPLPLIKLGFPSGSFHGVGGKRASEALSFLAVFSLIFLFLLVFAQTNALGTLSHTYLLSTVKGTDLRGSFTGAHPKTGKSENSLFPRSARTTSIEENGGK